MSDLRVLVIVPTYNERDNLPILIDAVFAVLDKAHVLVVDDAQSEPFKAEKRKAITLEEFLSVYAVEGDSTAKPAADTTVRTDEGSAFADDES